jgi:hypothetical protein
MTKATSKRNGGPESGAGADPGALAAALERHPGSIHADVTGPIQVLSVAAAPEGGLTGEVSAQRLVPLDSDDPGLSDVFIPIPVNATVSMGSDGKARARAVPDPSADMVREARAWARNLIANGQVRGVARTVPAYGPPVRPTHELVPDSHGRRVIRRLGFDAT